jgi:hypothetical protein
MPLTVNPIKVENLLIRYNVNQDLIRYGMPQGTTDGSVTGEGSMPFTTSLTRNHSPTVQNTTPTPTLNE